MIGVKAQVRECFFDRPAVIEAIDAKTRAMLMKFGAHTMATAKQSIRTRKKASAVGSPPSNHTGRLRDNIQFAFDPARKSVVIGPVILPRSQRGGTDAVIFGGGTVPEVLEYGGREMRPMTMLAKKHKVGDFGYIRIGEGKPNKTRSIRRTRIHGRQVIAARVKLISAAMVARADRIDQELAELNLYQYGSKQHTKTINIGPRPYMAPAFTQELGVLDTLWQSA